MDIPAQIRELNPRICVPLSNEPLVLEGIMRAYGEETVRHGGAEYFTFRLASPAGEFLVLLNTLPHFSYSMRLRVCGRPLGSNAILADSAAQV